MTKYPRRFFKSRYSPFMQTPWDGPRWIEPVFVPTDKRAGDLVLSGRGD